MCSINLMHVDTDAWIYKPFNLLWLSYFFTWIHQSFGKAVIDFAEKRHKVWMCKRCYLINKGSPSTVWCKVFFKSCSYNNYLKPNLSECIFIIVVYFEMVQLIIDQISWLESWWKPRRSMVIIWRVTYLMSRKWG